MLPLRVLAHSVPVFVASAVLVMLACSGDGGTEPPEKDPAVATALAKVGGDGQSAAVGTTLPNPLVVSVKDQYGEAMRGVAVSWEVTAGGGAVSSATTTTGSNGNASVNWTLGTVAGENAVRASVARITSEIAFTVTAMPGEVATLAVTPDSASFDALEDTAHVVIEAADEYGNEVAADAIGWSSSNGSVATVANEIITAQGNGSALIVASAGGRADTVAVTVKQVPTDATIAAGNSQTGPAGEPLPVDPAVAVVDANGYGVPGVPVLWGLGEGSGSISTDSVDTSPGGVGAVSWTLGLHSGTDTVVATVGGFEGTPFVFTATATPNGVISGSITFTSVLQSTTAVLGTMEARRSTSVSSSSIGGLSRDGPRETPAPTRTFSRTGPEYVEGSLIITFHSNALGAPPAGAGQYRSTQTARAVGKEIRSRVAAHASYHGFQVRGVSPAILAARLEVPPDRLEAVRAALSRDPTIASAEREALVYGLESTPTGTVPNDPYYRAQAWHYGIVDLPEAWSYTTGSTGVIVAVVDDGIRFDHPDIAGNLTSDGYDFVTNTEAYVCGALVGLAGDGDGYDPDPTNPLKVNTSTCDFGTAHGLHVAGTIGATGNDGQAVTGVNWSVRIRPIRVLRIDNTGTSYDIAQGVLYAAGLPADDGVGGTIQASSAADVINLSIGGATQSTDVQNAVEAAAQAGVLLVASAGNDNVSTPYYPAAYPEVLSVSAVGADGELASYSNYGSTIDIAAPGGDVVDGGETHGVLSTTWDFNASTPRYDFLEGTSMAAPHVSGVAALLLAREPDLSASQLRSRLLDYAADMGPTGRDDAYGYGLLNARNSLTASHAPERDLYARLYDASNGTILTSIPAESDGSYSFEGLEDGSYYVFAGLDHDGDQLVGWPGRMWGAFGNGTASPSPVAVSGAGTYPASFSVGWPYESEPNNLLAEADDLVTNAHLRGDFSTVSDVDVYSVTLPAGQYTFETSGWIGSCWYANESDTVLELYDGTGQLIASNDDVDPAALNYCSRISTSLNAGTYEIRVLHDGGGEPYRLYQLHLREGT